MSPPPKIVEAILDPDPAVRALFVPVYPYKTTERYVSEPSLSVLLVKPQRCLHWEIMNLQPFKDMGRDLLLKHDFSALDNERVPVLDKTHWMLSEGDNARLIYAHVIRPLNLILSCVDLGPGVDKPNPSSPPRQGHRKRPSSPSQTIASPQKRTKHTRSKSSASLPAQPTTVVQTTTEQTLNLVNHPFVNELKGKSLSYRPDCTMYRSLKTIGQEAPAPDLNGGVPGASTRAFGVLELKRLWALAPTRFRNDILISGPRSINQRNHPSHKLHRRAGSKRLPVLHQFEQWISQQAASYALSHRIQHVAVLCWSSAYLFRFTDIKLWSGISTTQVWVNGLGTKARVAIVDKPEDLVDSLLGFCLEAYRETPRDGPDKP